MKRKSIVKKQMMLYLGTIAASVVILSVVLSMVYTRHYMNEKRDELIEQGQKIAAAIKYPSHLPNGQRVAHHKHRRIKKPALLCFYGNNIISILPFFYIFPVACRVPLRGQRGMSGLKKSDKLS